MKKKAELLAPAGNMESLKAAVAGGCDAVYLGLQSFSARAFAGNFSHEEFQEAIRYCHIHDVKIYVTINTMLYETEIENAKKEVAFLYENDCDGILIQDPGLFDYVRKCYPDMDVHCSTQMHIHNLDGVKLMQKLGAKRVVLARETPIEIIREACATGMDIEVFAYGAICISYSGECLMSSAVKNRSANRGMCAQCCRLKYFPEQGEHFEEGDYILSPKDLNVIDRLPELLEAGVASLKIEGRMKRPEYVWLVVKTFREAIDAWYENRPYHVSQRRERDLLLMFNRGFSQGHIFHAGVNDRMSQFRPNHHGVEIGRVTDFHHDRVQVKLSAPLYQHDGLRILNEPHDTGLTAVKIYKNDLLVNQAGPGDMVWLECHSKPSPKRGQPLMKTTDARLIETIRNEIRKGPAKIPVTMEYHAEINTPFILTVRDQKHEVTVVSNQDCQTALKAPLSDERIRSLLEKTGDSAYTVNAVEGSAGNIFLPVSVINETRRKALEQLDEIRSKYHQRKGKQAYSVSLKQPDLPADRLLILSDELTSSPHGRIFHTGYEPYDVLPVVNERMDERYTLHNCILSSLNDLYHERKNCIAGMTMNIANSYAAAFMLENGCDAVIFSSEMNQTEILQTLQSFSKRYGFELCAYQLVYGKRTVMYIKDGFRKDRNLKSMEDMHGNVYEIAYNSDVTMIREPDVYRSANAYCYGSVLILDQENRNAKEITEEAYEEISERV